MKKKVAVIGGGAAGVFCAIQLGTSKHLDVSIFEKSNELLKKVKISGGGRCNVTHRFISNAQFSKNYPRGQKILKQNFEIFSPLDMYSWLETRSVKLKTEADGRVFPVTDNSQTIIDCFIGELEKLQIPVFFLSEVSHISEKDKGFELKINHRMESFDYVVIATGGPQKERDLDIYANLNSTTVSPVPSLFTFKIQEKELTELMGLSIKKVSIRILGSGFRELGDVLITHWGLSGPAILKLSAWGAFFLNEKNYRFQISINWMGDSNEGEIISEIDAIIEKHGKGKVSNYKLEKFPQRFWDYLLMKSEIEPSKKWSEISKKNKNKLCQILTNTVYDIHGKTTYKEEFVTAGGIHTDSFHSKTMASTSNPNLYYIGEITNIDGITGGFNFQNAWTSAVVCAQDIKSRSE